MKKPCGEKCMAEKRRKSESERSKEQG